MTIHKKLIEVALPLDAINTASAREKSIRHGHPSTLHLWWARRPLAAARAVIFAQMVDDPSAYLDVLMGDPAINRAGEAERKKRQALWETRKALYVASGGDDPAAPEPGREPSLEECVADLERQRLFRIIEKLVLWENTTNETVLQAARDEIWASWRRACAENADHPRAKELFDRKKLPAFHDPFAGGGALPLEAQRLGLESYASDLNPVAVLINKAMIEIPPKFAGRPPVNPESQRHKKDMDKRWSGAQGLAEDVRYYGQWMRDEAEKRIGHLYPKVAVVRQADGTYRHPTPEELTSHPSSLTSLTVIAWLWARTVKSPNPAFAKVDVPLASTFMLSTKPGKEAYVEPVIEDGGYRFTVKVGKPKDAERAKLGTTAGKRSAFNCLMSGVPITYDHIRAEGKAERIGVRLMAIVAEGDRGRVYLAPTPEHEAAARQAKPTWKPEMALPDNPRDFKTPNYGLTTYGDLFTPRQLVALTTFSDLVQEARERVKRDALEARKEGREVRSESEMLSPHSSDLTPLSEGGTGTSAYAEAVAVYLAFVVEKLAEAHSTICTWSNAPKNELVVSTFRRQAIPMTWDFAEANPYADSAGSIAKVVEAVSRVAPMAFAARGCGNASQADAARQSVTQGKVVSTDPPYCLAPGMLVLTPGGYVPIETICIGDRVLSDKGRFVRVTRTYRRAYAGTLLEVKVAHTSQPLRITEEHPVRAIRSGVCAIGYADYCHIDCAWQRQNGGRCSVRTANAYSLEWVPAGELLRNDLVFMPSLVTNAESVPESIDLASWLPGGDYLAHEGQLHYQKATMRSVARRTALDGTWRQYTQSSTLALTQELCRLLGYFVAEGYARVEPDGGTVQFTFHVEEEALCEDVTMLMRKCFELDAGSPTDNRKWNNRSVRLNFYSKPIATLLRHWCYDENGHKQLPEWALHLDEPRLHQLLRGYWHGDGSRANAGYVASTNSVRLAGQLRMIMLRLGITARLHVHEVAPGQINGKAVIARGPQYGLFVTGPSLLHLAAIVGDPKREALATRRGGQHGAWWPGGMLMPIRTIKSVPFEGMVYNLETEDHSYVTAAGSVHNCDNIGYADLSDFFYVWLRRSLRSVFPGLFGTMAVPKAEELVSTPYRHESKERAERFFREGMERALARLAAQAHTTFPVTIYYAYKQQETASDGGTVNTGWAGFLESVFRAGFSITGTWPIRTERDARSIGIGTNALASSIVLVCRKRPAEAPTATRREFVAALKAELPSALARMQQANIAPVDLAQASIGPGMAVYTRYARVLDAEGKPLTVRQALALINEVLDEALAEQEGDFDADTRWALAWFDPFAFNDGPYGVAETLSKAKNTAVSGLVEAGIAVSGAGRVRLLRPADLPADWDPETDKRLTVWEIVHQLIRALESGGEGAAGELVARLGARAETARELAYRLYTLCERKKRAAEALAYNGLVQSFPEIVRLAQAAPHTATGTGDLFEET